MRSINYVTITLSLTCFLGVVSFFPMDVSGASKSSAESVYGSKKTSVNVKDVKEVIMIRGDLITIKAQQLRRISITNPEVADAIDVNSNKILLIARQPGQTMLFLWDKGEKHIITVSVAEDDLDRVKKRIESLLKEAGIEEIALDRNDQEGKLVVQGDIAEDKRDDLNKIIGPFSSHLINFVKDVPCEDLVQIDVQIAEVSSSFSKNLGFNWTSALTYNENFDVLDLDEGLKDIFKIGDFARSTAIVSTLNALISEGKGKVLSKPKIVVISGKSASFLVGGEIPVLSTSTSSGGTTTENVEFKSYGVDLQVTPTIRKGKVDVEMNVNVSEVDAGHSVGSNVAFTTRSAQTQLYLDDGQTVVLAGLIKSSTGETVQRIPLLGSIPIIGALFRYKSTPAAEEELELVITLTPTILYQDGQMMVQKFKESKVAAEELLSLGKKQEKEKEKVKVGKEPSPESVDAFVESLREDKPKDKKTKKGVVEVKGIDSSKAKSQKAVDSYAKAIQKKVSQTISYPYEAKERGWNGTVRLTLYLLPDGTLKNIKIKESSGYKVFDKDAFNTVQILEPFPPFPAELDLKELIITIPVVYDKKLLF